MNSANNPLTAELLNLLDGTGSDKERAAIHKLKLQFGSALPEVLEEHYRMSRGWKVRAACIFYCLAYARSSSTAIELGKLGVLDKSKVVRYRSCMLLACSLNKELLPFLKEKHDLAEGETKADIAATIDVIENQNQNLFLDREHTGMVTLNVKPYDSSIKGDL